MRVKMTDEDEAFEEIERKLWAEHKARVDAARRKSDGARYLSVIEEAEYKSLQFVTDYNGEEMGQMSIRKAYEMGYRASMHEVERKKNGQN
jgi:hypothetical protein